MFTASTPMSASIAEHVLTLALWVPSSPASNHSKETNGSPLHLGVGDFFFSDKILSKNSKYILDSKK
jgi:hypothetical protein